MANEKTIMFLRHGNVIRPKGFYASEYKLFLSENGLKQVRNIASEVEKFEPEIIFSSPIPRVLETANIVNQKIKVKIIKDFNLRERVFPSLFDMDVEKIEQIYGKEFLVSLRKGSELVNLPTEETIEDASKRVLNCFYNYLSFPQKRILIVAHGGPHSWICCHLFNIDLRKLRLFSLDEANFSIFKFEDKNFSKIITLNSSKLCLL